MRTLKHYLSTLLLLPITAFGQATFKQGQVTALNGTARSAEVRVVNWVTNPRNFILKAPNGTHEEANLTNTAAIQVNGGRRFERAVIRKSLNRIKYPRIPSRPDNRMVADTVFLEVLAEGGKVALLSLADSIKTRYFVRKTGGAAEELRYQIYRAREQGGTIIEINTFREQLTSLVNDSQPLARAAINRATYNHNDLTEVVTLINDNEIAFKARRSSPVRFMAGAGVAHTAFTISGEAGIAGSKPDQIISVYPLIGVEWTLNPERNNAIIHLTGQASRAKAHFYSINDRLEETKNFTQWSYSLSPVFLYRLYNRQNFKIVAGAGFSANWFHYSDDRTTLRQVELPGSKPIPAENEDGFQSLSFSVPLRAGVSFGKIDAMLTWSKELTNLITLVDTSMGMSRTSVSLTYVFGR
ncbi:hypothetical protein C7T94_16720 [Pedobacter yulinensis]|uniref:Outer membrane protein beta-barrel domain-containing protein n=1 Tax=Pedobacter yulinensis TaxID=2126353 RepID=A0A2T3HIY6_9SPHI|nr:hypothetical protein [Pedobacter yulinensis]PST82415.1 hypothetical protein C7T94_16720 [Pedobacter yulinensis]